MGTFLPSEIARLVLGYLEDQKCMVAYNEFLNRCSHLVECRGREFFTTIMGLSLNDILDDYCAIHSHIRNIKCDDEFKNRVGKCQRLLEKVKLCIDERRLISNNHGKESSRCLQESHENVHRKVHRRNNSCDSVVTVKTEGSYGCHQRTNSNDRTERGTYFSKVGHHGSDEDSDGECSAEATHLEDLPGYRDDGSYWHDVKTMKNQRRMHLLKKTNLPTGFISNSKSSDGQQLASAQLQSENTNKSLDRTLTDGKLPVHPSTMEFDFRKALGLIKQSDSSPYNVSLKSPSKRKNIKSKLSPLVRKVPHTADPFPNESLNVTTITNAMLDCTELHEIIADNINKIYNMSTTKPMDAIMEIPKMVEASHHELTAPKTADENTDIDIITIEDDLPEFENVIKSIVEKTEKEPLFDQLLNDVLAASVESTSGTESDVLSRPDTSTPEKSAPSLVNESSPTSSYRSSVTSSNKKCQAKDQVKQRKKRARDSPHSQDNIDGNELQSTSISPIPPSSCESKNTQSNIKKYYPRYPRGGKKMDLLKENYKNVIGGDKRLSVPPSQRLSRSATKALLAKPDPKVIILSNEVVHTNLLIDKGPIVIQKADDVKDKISTLPTETQTDNCIATDNETVKIVSGHPEILPDTQLNKTSPPSTSKTQHSTVKVTNSITPMKHSSNLFYQSVSPLNPSIKESSDNPYNQSQHNIMMPMPDSLLPSQQNYTAYYTGYHPQTNISTGNHNMFTGCIKGGESWQKKPLSLYGRTVTGKPPELVISNGRVTSGFGGQMDDNRMEPIYSKSEIMDMPTIIVIQPTTNSTVTSNFIEVLPDNVQFKPNFPQTQHQSTAIKQNSERKANVKILPKITSLNDIVNVLDLENHCDKSPQKSQTTSIPERKTNGSQFLPAIKNVSEVIEKDLEYSHRQDTNTDILSVRSYDSSEGGRFVIDEDQKKNPTGCRDSLKVNTSSVAVENDKDKSGEFEILKGNTPDVVITKKMSFSTPRRNFSHVRVLDFNTPSNSCNRVLSRKAFTSPKNSSQTSNTTLQTPSVHRNTNLKMKMKNVKSCLFQHIEETELSNVEKNVQSDCQSVESTDPQVSEVWDEIQGVSKILKPSFPDESQTKVDEVKKTSSGTKELKKPSASAWDLNLRMMVGVGLQNTIPSKYEVKANDKKKCRTNVQNRKIKTKKLTDSLKKEAKLLEEALLNKSFETSPGPSKNVEININKSYSDKAKDVSPLVEKGHADQISRDNIAGDLEMSTNTTIEEVSNNEHNIRASQGSSVNNVKCISENSHPSNDSSNSRDHLINLKFKRDAYTKTNLLKKEAISPLKKVSHTSKVKFKPNQCKNTFKVKFTSKNHTNSIDDAVEKKAERSEVKRSESKTKSKSSRSSRLNSKSKSKAKNKVSEVVASVVPSVEPSVEVEPPVPSVKITPDMPRGFNCNPSNAKYNLSSLLETPLKTIMMDLSMDTPKFFDQNFGESVSVMKILDIPTPNFVNTPSVSAWFAGKGHTPGSYSSRPTDYSGGSSYYKPDEVEDVNFKVAPITASKTVEHLSIINEEIVDAPDECNLSTRVLRPRPANSNKSVTNTVKPQESVLSNSTDRTTESKSRVRKPSLSDSDSKSSDSNSSASCSCSFPSSSSGEEQDSPIKKLINKIKMPKKGFLASNKHFSSTPISANISSQHLKNEKQMNKCKNKENDSAHNQHDSLEEKRLRVISKLVTQGKKDTPPKLMANAKSPVSRLIKRTKVSTNTSTKLPAKNNRRNDSKKGIENTQNPVKRSVSRKRFSPLKKTPLKRCPPRKAKSKTTLNTPCQENLSSPKNTVECQFSSDVNTVKTSIPVIGPVKPLITKSRRKSSTPRKLEKLLFEPIGLECRKETHAKLSQLTEAPNEMAAADINNTENLVENTNISKNTLQLQNNHLQLNDPEIDMKSADDYPSLHLSSDEGESELTPQAALSTHSSDECCDNILRINEYIVKSATEEPKTVFQANLVKEGFDAESAKKIEKDLTDPMLDDEESLLGLSKVVSCHPKLLNTSSDRVTEDVVHPKKQNAADVISVKENSSKRKNTETYSKFDQSSTAVEEKKSIETNSNIVTDAPKSVCSSPTNFTHGNHQPGVIEINSVNIDANLSSEIDSKFTEEAYLWDDYECTYNDVNYIFSLHDKVSPTTKKDDSFSDIAKFTLNATIDEDEVRVITVSKLVDLFEIVPSEHEKSHIHLKSEREVSKKRRSRELIMQCFNEGSNSSFESLSPIKKPCEPPKSSEDNTNILNEEQESAVKNVLSDKFNREDVSRITTNEHGCVINSSPLHNRTIESANNSTSVSDGELTCSAIEESSHNSFNTSKEEPSKIQAVEKRKRSDDDNSEESDCKKVKPIDAQHLFKQLDIESILSKLHGPQ